MGTIVLTEEEVELINKFKEEMQKIPVVESVFVEAYKDKEAKEKIDVYVEANYYTNYVDLLYMFDLPFNEKQDYKTRDDILDRFTRKAVDTRLRFKKMPRGDISFSMMRSSEIAAVSTLGNSTILFDRFDFIRELQEKAQKWFEKSEHVLDIENIDQIMSTGAVVK